MEMVRKTIGKNKEYECEYEWPNDCFIQGGDTGLVLSKKGSYKTAFVEVFLNNPKTFIRGEGATIKDAENKAWEQFNKIINCKCHEFERRNYDNGAGFCKNCGLFKSDAFEPTTKCKFCLNTTYYMRLIDNEMCCKECLKDFDKVIEYIPDFMISILAMEGLNPDDIFSSPIEDSIKELLLNRTFDSVAQITEILEKNKNRYVAELFKRNIKKGEYPNQPDKLISFMKQYYQW